METVKLKSDSEQRLDMAKKDADSAHTEKSNAVQKSGALQSQLDEERSKKSEMEKMFKALELKLKDTSDKHVQEKEVKYILILCSECQSLFHVDEHQNSGGHFAKYWAGGDGN